MSDVGPLPLISGENSIENLTFILPAVKTGVLFHDDTDNRFLIAPGGTARPEVDTAIYLGSYGLPAGALDGDVWINADGVVNVVDVSTPPEVVGVSSVGWGNLSDLKIPIPAGAQPGDRILLLLRAQSSAATSGFSASGYSDIGPAITYPSTAYRVNTALMKKLTTAETGDITITAPASAGASRAAGEAYLIRGLSDTDTVISVALAANGWSLYDVPDIDDHTLIIISEAGEFTSGNDHARSVTIPGLTNGPMATTSELTTTSRTALYTEYANDLDPIEAGSVTFVGPAVSSPASMRIVLRGETKSVYPPPQLFLSTTDFLTTPGATSAHRGLSSSYPEMSAYAYDHASHLGFGAVEVSLGRTSDGVWFGIHDSTLARTSPSATTINSTPVSGLTWAQVQTAQIEIGASGAPRPYATFQEIIDTAPNCIFIVDPKASGNTAEFLDFLDAHGGPSRFIVKGYRGMGYLPTARARGYKIANYLYGGSDGDDPQNPSFASWVAEADTIGLNWDAGTEDWEILMTALGSEKTAWAHLISNDTNYATAISRGASWIQCTSSAVTPHS